tara:strand:+ start:687 stop:1136 length:450 start_codon:yes stop_codon:yes gene_type:complete
MDTNTQKHEKRLRSLAGQMPLGTLEARRDLLEAVDFLLEQTKKVDALEALLNTPEIVDFVSAVTLEAQHQRLRWGADGDAGKSDAEWFWLIGYLAGKALHNPPNDMVPQDARLHRIITVAAAAANWHAACLGHSGMRPGIDPSLMGANK